MDAPVIRWVAVGKGQRAAFHVMGSGPAVAMLFPYHVNHLALNWRVPLHRGAIRFLARHFTVINLDFPGAGLSVPFKGPLSLASLSGAVDAVREAAGVERLALCAMGAASLIACDVAARFPQRVSRVALIAGGRSEANGQILRLRRRSPDIEAQLRGALLSGVGDKRNAEALADVARASLHASTLTSWQRLLQRESVLKIADRVSAPTLYFHASADTLVPRQAAQALVQRIGNATLREVAGKSGMDVWRNRAAVHEMVAFLKGSNPASAERARGRGRPTRSQHHAGLSEREVEVIRQVAIGRTNQQIAEDLFISLNTVSYHLRNIFSKTGAANRTEAAALVCDTTRTSRA